MVTRLVEVREQFFREAAAVRNSDDLGALRDRYLGRKSGLLAAEKKRVGALAAAERAEFGRQVNELSAEVEAELARLASGFQAQAEAEGLARETIDISLPGTRPRRGHLHPITLVRHRLEEIFVSMGYSIEDGPEIETSYYNFDALNIPPGHPARDAADTFYLSE